MAWAVFKDGHQVSKSYPIREQALIDAVERKMVWSASPDFGRDAFTMWLAGCEIKEVED